MFRKKKTVVLCLRPPQNRTFHVVVVNRKQKKCTKMRDACAMLLCCQSKSIAFLPFSLPSPSSLLKLSNDFGNITLGRHIFCNVTNFKET